MNNSNNNSKLSAWIFVFVSCAFIITIGYKTKNKSNLLDTNKSITQTDNNMIDLEEKENSKLDPEENSLAEHENDNNQINLQEENKEVLTVSNNIVEQKNIKNDIYVNRIIISKNIDDDKNSDTYRDPIDAFKTISTLDESVIKEIDYYPALFIWSSVNTENVTLVNQEQKIEPINLSMILKCKDKLIEKLDYNITANTPRWREWIEINLENIDDNMVNEFWDVEIIDNRNNAVLESRKFKLIDYYWVLEQASMDVKTELELKEK